MRAIKKNMKDDRRILHCPSCNAEFSGNAGDYWYAPDDHVFTCRDCGIEMELVKKCVSVTYV